MFHDTPQIDKRTRTLVQVQYLNSVRIPVTSPQARPHSCKFSTSLEALNMTTVIQKVLIIINYNSFNCCTLDAELCTTVYSTSVSLQTA